MLNGLDRVSEETRRRVEQAARELSYVPNNFAASMVTGQSKILGIIVPSFTHDFFGFIAQTAEHVFRKHGYLTIVSASGEDPVADPAAFLQRFYHMLDGVLLVPTAARLKDLESFDKPLLLVDRDMPGSSFSSISFDNEPACYELTRRLTEKGHRRIGLLVLNSPMNIGADRLAGCLRALREAGVEQDPALVRCCAAAAVDGYTQTRLMMTMPDPPTAIVCCSEELCTGAVRACMDLSLVPGRDISLVSFDELITPLAPTAITSVFSPRRKMAKVAAERLLEMVANPAKRTPRKDVVETIIHEQHSIAQL